MASIAETDQNGAYKLENVPPGRYYIVAGRIDVPTYYPGTLDMSAGKDVLISPGASITGMNFALKDNSAGRADARSPLILATSWTIPIRVILEGGGKIPIYDDGMFPVLRLTRVDNQILEASLTSSSVVVPVAANPEYRVTIEGLSKRYTVKSIVSDKTNLVSDLLKLPPPPAPILVITPPATTSITVGGQVTVVTSFYGLLSITNLSVPTLPPVPTIEITLRAVSGASPRTGATLSGKIAQPLGRSIEVSGVTGTIYEDGAFELKNVPPGRHTILTRNNPAGTRPLGASIIVGDQDIPNIQLQGILELPRDLDANVAATLRGTYNPGTVVPLATVRGHLVDESTSARMSRDRSIGRITINGNTVSYTINDVGEFEIPGLLPGRYDLDLLISGGNSYSRTLEVRDEDTTVVWPLSVPD
jgi:hypothetical protein